MSQVSAEWIIGWKIAYLYCTKDLTIQFAPVHQDGIISPHGIDAEAECQQYPGHIPPQDGCHCGFNAWHDRSVIERVKMRRNAGTNVSMVVQLRVGLYGDVVEGTLWSSGPAADVWGYRGSQQRVADVFVSQRCYRCNDMAVGLALTYQDFVFGWCLHPVCESCKDVAPFITLNGLATKNNVDMHWMETSSL